MKKIMKSLTLICLAVLMVCPLMLAGCARNYTITIEVAGGQGVVLEKGYEGKNVVGENAVKEGTKFEYFIKPTTGYQIAKIEIDGVEYTENYVKEGTYLSFEEVDGNHTVKVTFEAIDRYIRFECMGGDGEYVTYSRTVTDAGGKVLLYEGYATVKHGSTLDLATNYFYGKETGKIEWKIYTGTETIDADAVMAINGDKILRTDLQAEELDVIFGINA